MSYEQSCYSVRSFSNEYGPPYSISQTMRNVCGQPSDVPEYGDHQYAAVFRHYGCSYTQRPSNVAFPLMLTPKWFPYTDFVECTFSTPVYPESIQIFENFFPGSVRRILGTRYGGSRNQKNINSWQVLWVYGQNGCQGNADHLFAYSLNEITFHMNSKPIDTIRIEFDFTHSEYYYQLEAVKLSGVKYVEELVNQIEQDADTEVNCISSSAEPFHRATQNEVLHLPEKSFIPTCSLSSQDFKGIDTLPSEILIKILGYLDIGDLCRASRINKLFCRLSKDPALYNCINLRPFYRFLVDQSIVYISSRCCALRKLEMSWLGTNNQISTPVLCHFLRNVPNLVELRLSSCSILASSVLETLAIYCSNLELLDISYSINGLHLCVSWLTNLKHLKYLNLGHTLMTTSELLYLLAKLQNLEWLLIGSPSLIADQDTVINLLTWNPCGKLKGIELWYWDKISFSCISQFLHCHGKTLVELDLGWCLSIGLHDILPNIAGSCPNLVVLVLTAHHETTDAGLIDLSKGCKFLWYLDLLGSRNITFTGLHALGVACHKLKLLDVSYCSKISVEDVASLQMHFSHISIKHVETYLQKSKVFSAEGNNRSL